MASIINASTSSGLVQTADTSGTLQLQTASTNALYIDASQSVGIGTSSPTQKLDVYTGSANYSTITTRNTISGLNVAMSGTGDAQIVQTGVYSLQFATNNTERMRIDSSGNVLINTTTAGTTNTQGWGFNINSNACYLSIGHITGTTNGNPYINFNYNGTSIGGVAQNTTSSVSYNTSSDYRLKDNIVPMTGALDKVAQLKPVTYTWKIDNSAGQGFIAHELQAVVPDCVTGEKDAVDAEGNPVYQGVDTSFLVATLTAAIQEQQTIINDLKARITALEGAK